jgi:hypothetical protein
MQAEIHGETARVSWRQMKAACVMGVGHQILRLSSLMPPSRTGSGLEAGLRGRASGRKVQTLAA